MKSVEQSKTTHSFHLFFQCDLEGLLPLKRNIYFIHFIKRIIRQLKKKVAINPKLLRSK